MIAIIYFNSRMDGCALILIRPLSILKSKGKSYLKCLIFRKCIKSPRLTVRTCFLNRYVIKLQTLAANSKQALKLIKREFHIGILGGIRPRCCYQDWPGKKIMLERKISVRITS